VRVWNIANGRCETVISGHSDSVETVKWGGNGLIYTCSRDRTIMVWEIDGHGKSAQKLMRTLTGHAHRINTLALSCDYVLRTGHPPSLPVSLLLTSLLSLPCTTGWYEFGPIGSSTDLSIEEKQQKALERYQQIVGSEGERLVSGSDDFTLFLWKPSESKSPVTRMTGHQQLVNHIVFSPDSRYIASASFDKKIKIWCGKTGRFLHTLSGHVNSVYQISWSADSVFIVSASKDSTLKLWSIKSPKKALETLAGHADEVYSVDWSPDGTQVASGSKDRTIKIWHH
jgi:ribosome assembly protein 4